MLELKNKIKHEIKTLVPWFGGKKRQVLDIKPNFVVAFHSASFILTRRYPFKLEDISYRKIK